MRLPGGIERPAKAQSSGRKLVYLCDWLPPDFGAVGQYSMLFARELAEEGWHVTLAGLSSSGESELVESLGSGSLRIVRLAAAPYDKTSFAQRLLWTARVNTRLVARLWRRMREADRIVFTGSPPLLLHWIAPANLLLGKELVYRITDFHPECAIAQRGHAGIALGALYRLTVFWRRRVQRFEALGEDQVARLAAIGIERGRIAIKRDPSPVTIDGDTRPLARPPGSEGRLLLLYSGNWGVAHDYRTFLAGYRRHHESGRGRLVLWLNAVGAAVGPLARALEAEGLPFVRGKPVPIEDLASLLVTADAHLVTLHDAFVGFVLPSKIYGCIASGKPVLFVGAEGSDVHLLSSRTLGDDYRRVEVGDEDGCAAALDALARRIDAAAGPVDAECPAPPTGRPG
ncbi:MAG: hypothetical protein AB7O57_19175 [Hyphomicrobiaceae bacterium]